MNKLTSLLTALVFASLIIFVSCGDDDGGGDPQLTAGQEAAATLANGTYTVSSVTNDNDDETALWTGFTLSFSTPTNDTAAGTASGTYTTTNIPATPDGATDTYDRVWPASPNNTWTINSAGSSITRGDDLTITVSGVTETSATLTINNIPTARTSGIDGTYVFTFTR